MRIFVYPKKGDDILNYAFFFNYNDDIHAFMYNEKSPK